MFPVDKRGLSLRGLDSEDHQWPFYHLLVILRLKTEYPNHSDLLVVNYYLTLVAIYQNIFFLKISDTKLLFIYEFKLENEVEILP